MTAQRRKHLRLPLESTTYIELPSSRVTQGTPARTIACSTLDISRGGLQVMLAEELTVGVIMNVGIDLPGVDGTLHVAGEVRWCLQSKDSLHAWMAGFQLLNAENTDYEQWRTLIAGMER